MRLDYRPQTDIFRQTTRGPRQLLQRHVILVIQIALSIAGSGPSSVFGERLSCLVFLQLGYQPNMRFHYSVFGDSVNLASRLEGQSKEYGFPIIVGSKTALAVKDKFAILELDFIMVKGKKEPEVIYAIAGREDTAHSGRFQRLRNLTIEMLACYRSRDWEGALEAIERGRKTDEANALKLLYNLYEARIRDYQKNPPPEDWNGAFALLTK
jgi:adenylate cyclase